MNFPLNASLSGAVSLDLENSWAGRSLQEALRLAHRDARFQQKQMQEKEEKLLRLYENQQQRAFEKVSRGSSGSGSVSGSVSGGTSPVGSGPGRVRQMFDERRQKASTGIDRSYPLEPLKQTTRLNGHSHSETVSSLDRSNTISKNSTKQSIAAKASVRRTVSNVTGAKTMKSQTIMHTANRYEENNYYEDRMNDNEHAMNMMKNQQKELELMMNNHNINDSLEDEELPDIGIDDVDSLREISPPPNENENYRKPRPIEVSTKRTPPTRTTLLASSTIREKPTARKIIAKTTPTKTSSPAKTSTSTPRSSAQSTSSISSEKKSPVKSVAPQVRGASNNKPATSRIRGVPSSNSVRDDLASCKFCQRRFASDRVTKHEEICGRTLKKKRKPFDPVKHRVQGTDAENYVKKGATKAAVTKSNGAGVKASDWRRKHEEFISAIRAAKQAQAHVAAGGKLSDLPPPPPSLNPDYVQCPHCSRRFNQTAADRHIPKCRTMMHNKPKPAKPTRK